MNRILVIEDDPDIQNLIQFNLSAEGFDVETASDGQSGLDRAKKIKPDLVVLDLMLPLLNGIEVCKGLRNNEETRSTPVIMLTAKGEESDVVFGLGVGADDYMIKPFSMKELVARIYTRLRGPMAPEEKKDPQDITRYGGIEINRSRFEVTVSDAHVPMTLAEFRLFDALMSRPGVVMSRDTLLDAVTGGEGVLIDRNIDVHVRSIRKKLGEERDLIQTVRGLGYKFKDLQC